MTAKQLGCVAMKKKSRFSDFQKGLILGTGSTWLAIITVIVLVGFFTK
jgi:hypothetical protein